MSEQTQEKPIVNEAVASLLDAEHSTCGIDEFNHRPMFVINKQKKYPFSFGLPKARLIVKHYDALSRFVETEGKTIEPYQGN